MKKFVFISIPKNASQSVHNFFGVKWKGSSKPTDTGIMDNHARAVVIRDRYGLEQFESRFKFAFVRNPWDRCVSWYEFHRKMGLAPYNRHSFESWIKAGMPHHWKIQSKTDYRTGISPLSQYIFIVDENNDLIVDFVGRVENIDSDMTRVLTILGDTRKFSTQSNKSNRSRDYRKYYNTITQDIVADILHKDIEMFGYTF